MDILTDEQRVSRMSRKEINAEVIHLSREQEEYERKIAYLEETLRYAQVKNERLEYESNRWHGMWNQLRHFARNHTRKLRKERETTEKENTRLREQEIGKLSSYILENELMPKGFHGSACECAISLISRFESALVDVRNRLGDFQEPWSDREREVDEIAREALATEGSTE